MARSVDLPLLIAEPREAESFFAQAVGAHYDVRAEEDPDRAVRAGVASTRYALRFYAKGGRSPLFTLRIASLT